MIFTLQQWYLLNVMHAWMITAADELWTARKRMPSQFPIDADAQVGRGVETALTLNVRLSPAQVKTLEAAIPVLKKDAPSQPVLNLPTPDSTATPSSSTPADKAAMLAAINPATYRPTSPPSPAPSAAALAPSPNQSSPPLAGHTHLDPNRPLGSFEEEWKTATDQLDEKLKEVEYLLERDPNFGSSCALPGGWTVFAREQLECFAITFSHMIHASDEALRTASQREGGLIPQEALKAAFAAPGADARQLRLLTMTKATLLKYGDPHHSALSALPILAALKELLRCSGHQDFAAYDGSQPQDLLSVLMAFCSSLWDRLGYDGACAVGFRTSTHFRCTCNGDTLADAITRGSFFDRQSGSVTAYPVGTLYLTPADFPSGSHPSVQDLVWGYLAEQELSAADWPPTQGCTCGSPSGSDFQRLHSCAHVLFAVIRRYTHPAAPLYRLAVDLTSSVWLTDAQGDRHCYKVVGSALHHGPDFHSPANHYTYVVFSDVGAVLLNDRESRLISEAELRTLVEPFAYGLVLVRQSTVPAATNHGNRVPATAGFYARGPRPSTPGKAPKLIDLSLPDANQEPSSSTVSALVDSPIKARPNSAPQSQSSFEALDVDNDSVHCSSPVKAVVAAETTASKAPTATVQIHVSTGTAFDERFKKEGVLGQGAFGVVSVATDLSSGEKVAVKVSKMSGEWRKYAMREAGAMSVLTNAGGHPAVCPLIYAAAVNRERGQEMALAMPLYLADLEQFASGRTDINKPITAVEARGVVLNIAKGLAYIHGQSVMHRDLKPGNVMVTAVGGVVIGDFGTARRFPVEGETELTDIGTLSFLAPELLLHSAGMEPPYGSEVDIFALGCLWYWLRQSQLLPFSSQKQSEAAAAARGVDRLDKAAEIMALVALAYSLQQVSPSCAAFPMPGGDWYFTFVTDDEDEDVPGQEELVIVLCLSFKPDDRPTADQLTQDDIFNPAAPTALPFGPLKMPGLPQKLAAAVSSTAASLASAVAGAASSLAKALSPPPSSQPKLPAKRSFSQLPFAESDSD